jgi:TolB-like protein
VRFRFGDCTLDRQRRELHRDARLVPIEPQVFDLLVYLLEHRDRVIGKDELVEQIWHGRIVSDATIDSRIMAARQAIGDSGAVQRLIRTLARKGVRFIGDVEEQLPAAAQASADTKPVHPAALQDKPSIAVLPFANLSGDPGQAYFADGVVEDIITALARIRWLFVIARNSTFAYKGHAIDIHQVGRELGVRYMLEGSVRVAGSTIRVTGQLIDVATAAHIWADRYDRPLDDMFAVQDEITSAIVAATLPALSLAEQRRAMRKPPESLDAWEAYQRGLLVLTEASDSDIASARQFFERAIRLDPHFAPAHAMLGHVTLNETSRGNRPFDEGCETVERHGRRAVSLDPADPGGHYVLSWVSSWRGDHEAALQHAEQAVATGPSEARAHLVKARALIMGGRAAGAAPHLEIALRLCPRDPFARLVLMHVAMAAYYERDYLRAITVGRQTIREFPAFPFSYVWLAAALGQIGEQEQAREALWRGAEMGPRIVVRTLSVGLPGLRPEDRAHLLDGLRKAGWRPADADAAI